MQKQFIPRRKDRRSAPLSFAQQRLWFLNQLEPESFAYNTAIALRFDGALNLAALSMALDAIVERHEVLRTTYVVEESSDPIQRIGQPQAVELPIIDLTECPRSERDEQAQRIIADLAKRPFKLDRDLMLRARLLRLALEQHVFVVVIHHVASDGWSSGILWRELAAYYTAFSQGKSVSLAELPIQYADYAAWQREWLSGKVLASQLGYWKKQLQDLPTLQLPADRPRPAVQSYRGAQQPFKLSEELIQALKKLSRDEGVTLFMTLLAAFQALLSRYSGQEDICIGSPIANRQYVEIEGLIGFFVNTLVLRSDLSGKPTFRELLSKVKWTALQSYAHQDLPFEKLVEELQPKRNLGVSPLFQVMFVFQNYPRNDFAVPGLAVSSMELHQDTAKFDLSLALTETTDGFEGRLEYSTDLFDPTTVARMIVHFQTLLEGIVANPEQRISELPLLTEAERHQLLLDWNGTKTDDQKDECIHELFEAQVERTPEAVAVVFEDQQLTYRELNKRANQLGHYLQKLGVGAEVLVGICVERSIEMVVGLLGILKAGGAYVPLDPSYPRERLGFMLEDAQARVLLTQQKLLSSIDHRSVVCLDRDWPEIAKENVKSPQNQAVTENLAYVIYTSGSTGTPKGVMIPHRGLVNYLGWATEAYEVAAGQGAPVHSSIGFDLSITSIFTPLLVGRRVVILPEDHGVEALCSLLRRETDFSLIKITPAHLEVLGQELPANKLAQCARALIIGGEALTFEKLKVWSKHASGTRLINEYGPTETVVGCCVHEVAPGMPPSGPVPIGRPIANTQLYILDRYLQPVPIGVAGELHIGGDGLARGYLNRPELTEEKFIANPFSADPVSRLYKTGDLARYLPDGNIEFLGRMDTQVKIRGYRIELGEIEAVLCQHPAIRDAIVMVREDNPGDKRLVAYVVQHEGASVEAKELRGHLKKKLPDYMVPSAFVFMDALPLTPNGKVDRSGLPMPEFVHRTEFIAPRTSMEDNIAEIWAEVLGLERVGIDDNFFELGGHSLLATQVVSRLRTYFNCDIPLRTLFEAPTVEGLAAMIIRQQASQVSETEMERLLDDVDAMSSEDAEQSYKD